MFPYQVPRSYVSRPCLPFPFVLRSAGPSHLSYTGSYLYSGFLPTPIAEVQFPRYAREAQGRLRARGWENAFLRLFAAHAETFEDATLHRGTSRQLAPLLLKFRSGPRVLYSVSAALPRGPGSIPRPGVEEFAGRAPPLITNGDTSRLQRTLLAALILVSQLVTFIYVYACNGPFGSVAFPLNVTLSYTERYRR